MEQILSKLVELLKASPRIWGALAFAGIAILVPSRIGRTIGLEEIRRHYQSWVAVGTIVFSVLFLTSLYDKVVAFFKRRHRAANRASLAFEAELNSSRRLDACIKALSPPERLVLTLFVATGEQTLQLSTLDDSVDRLIQRGLIKRFRQFPEGWRVAHAITPEIFDYLDNNRYLIGAEWRELERRTESGEPWY